MLAQIAIALRLQDFIVNKTRIVLPTKFIIFWVCLILTSCKDGKQNFIIMQGDIFGTYYRFQIDSDKNFSKQIDSVFTAINDAANVYSEHSEISQFNKTGHLENPSSTFFNMLSQAKKYHLLSNGYYSPSLNPIIKYWSHDLNNNVRIDSMAVDSLLKLSLLHNLDVNPNKITALKKGVEINLNAISEGYTIDAITSILDKAKVYNYMIEIGGEMKCKGKNINKKSWKVGIENPETSISQRGDTFIKIVELSNMALSTAGNYRKFYTDKLGNKYAHILDSKTGYTIKSSLRSVSILSNSSIAADAFATACMGMGTEQAMLFILNNPNIEGFLIFQEDGKLKTWQSNTFPIQP